MNWVCLLLGILAVGLPAARGQNSNLNCNFEQDFCQWTQSSTDKIDWKRINGTTPTPGTGPPRDHTTGHGNYAYFESSTGATGFNAQLTSPAVRVSARSKACLSFWFYMYGQHVNNLNVYLQKNNNNGQPVWQRTGNQGNHWINALVDIPVNTRAKVVLEAVRGRGYRGDIGIDDITYLTSPCPQSGVNTTTSVPCNFEDGRICGYQQDQSDNIDWLRASGATLTSGTGPNSDHTYGTQQGHYMYIDASNAQTGQKARLISPSNTGRRTMCLTFYYSMYGTGVDSLNVYTKAGNSLGQPVWSLSGNQGVGWNIAQVRLNRGKAFTVVFEAVRGQTFKGDIAIDDVSLARGSCPALGTCNFDRNLCGWANARQDDFDWLRHHGATGSSNTGPSGDHTHNNNQGYYLYIEASAPRRPNDQARLTSQVFRKSSRQKCFQFWYNMQGSNIGTLTVIMNVNGVDQPIWKLSGKQNGTWLFGRVPITNNHNNFKLAIVGTRGSGVQGDIALDDFTVRNSQCTISPRSAQPSQVTTKAPTTVTTKATTPGGTPPPASTNSVTCNFDSSFCGWTNPTNDDFDWTRQQRSTPSTHTGPTADHTSGHGYYVFTESSTRRANQKALLQSALVSQTGPHCLVFWYHMYGSDIGTLNLYIQTGATRGSPEWTRSGEQGNRWMTANVTFTPTAPFNLIFEGVMKTNGYHGDISMDDVTLTSGTCSGSSGVSGRTCAFEDSHLCGYTQDHTDVFDWTRNSGSTGSQGTGPTNDHTYGTHQGHYMYIETSVPRKLGDKARLISPSYTDSQAMCVQFYYHMYGTTIGSLNVYIQTGGQLGRAGFIMSNNGGNAWHLGEITVPSTAATTGYKVVFEGVRGSNARGDIAIDDIKFKTGPCQNPGECDFEAGLCTWANTQTGDQFDWTIKQGKTTSQNTGPTTDHTVGDSTGHYMYIETSAPRQLGNIAMLVSETFPPTSASGRCLSFWYSMYGQTIDTLTVLIRVQGVADQAIWSLTGNQGQQWLSANAPISMSSKSYQIVFQGRRGSAVTGDIAIDDISFAESSCGVRPSHAHPINGPTTLSTASTTPPTQGPFNCTFDTNFCGWTQDHTDNFDWSRIRGRTQSASTGPNSDHTSGRGYYVYTEASTPRRNGDKARLISPDVAATGVQTKCLTFWYLMMGRNVAQLNVYTKSGLTLPTTPIWRRNGNQGNRWMKAQVDITAKSVFNVVLESTRGGAYGDIAVDDVTISDGSCTQGPVAMSCDFESSTVCGFQQSHADQFDWTRGSGSTSSRGTGPSSDHTYGTSRGHYMFTEASGRRPGNKARLISPIYKGPSTPMCLKFWYHMYGSSGQTLNIYRLTRGVLGTAIWTKSGSQGNQWLVASVNIPVASQSNSPYQIVFEGIVGSNYRSDIGIDDFSISSGACLSEGACNFDNGFCTWTNAKTGDQFDWTLGTSTTTSTFMTAFRDHTGNNGQYAYLESSNPNHPGYDAKLMSESLSAHTHKCMYFWYNVYGSNIGTLRVWSSTAASNPNPLWELSSGQNQWYQGIVPLQDHNTSFTVIFEAVRGSSNTGHIAIDDVTFDDAQTCQRTPRLAIPTVTQAPMANTASTKTTPATTHSTRTTSRPMSTAKPTGGSNFTCDFTYDLCGWTQDHSDQFDWTRKHGRTQSGGTGPHEDHTTGGGYYIYTEASGRAAGNKARLVSPALQMTSGQQSCVTFWYTMYGAHVDSLNVYATTNVQTLGQPVWRRTANQGKAWRSSQFTLTGPGPLKVVFEASRGTSYQGDIAVDDISLAAGPCSGQTSTSNNSVGIWSCNFESSAICGYSQDHSDDFDWTRNHGRTGSSNTGPFSDHTLGTTSGNYMYIEVSRPRTPNQKARLMSPMTTYSTGPVCVSFWYHMYGRNIGALNLYTKVGANLGQPIWTRHNNQGNHWSTGQVTVQPAQPHQVHMIVFEGIVGNGIAGDIAIDDVNVTVGSCGADGACNFDKSNFCSWSNLKTDDFDWSIRQGHTPSGQTGPNYDHTQNNAQGRYIFIETSAPRRKGQKAQLQSESFTATGASTRCFKFWYHMYGSRMGTVNVYVVQNSSNTLMWTLSGNQGNSWHSAQFPVTTSQSFRVLIEGVVNGAVTGDAALDDLGFTNGVCGWAPTTAAPPNLTTPPTSTATTPATTVTTTPATTHVPRWMLAFPMVRGGGPLSIHRNSTFSPQPALNGGEWLHLTP